jgi:hypothetical protein
VDTFIKKITGKGPSAKQASIEDAMRHALCALQIV